MGQVYVQGAGRDGCVQSLVRALGLLDHLVAHGRGLSLSDVARRAGLPRSTAHRLLTTMQTMHYVWFDGRTGRWVAGARAAAVSPDQGPAHVGVAIAA